MVSVEENLKIARKTWEEYKTLPDWLDDEYEWYIDVGDVKYWVDYVSEDYIQITNDETKESENWEEIVEELAITAPSKIW
jgi:hypothetical protein